MSAAHLRTMEALQTVLEKACLKRTEAPLRLASSQNGSRGVSMAGIRAAAARKAVQRQVGWAAGQTFKRHLQPGVRFHVVRMVRRGPRELDDDNLAAAFKAVRDAVALALGVNDRDPSVRYVVDQESGTYGVRLELYAGPVASSADVVAAPFPPPHPARRPTPNVRSPL